MQHWIIIDGFNLLHCWDRNLPSDTPAFNMRREAMVLEIAACRPQLGNKVTLVFDGKSAQQGPPFRDEGLEIIYTEARQSADAVIEQMATQHPKPKEVLIVSSDRMILDQVSSAGCAVQSCSLFLDRLRGSQSSVRSTQKRSRLKTKPPTLGDFFPDS